jgi:DNA-binding transcriptional ArsR family regulator
MSSLAVSPDAFRAVSDPTRRALLDLLAEAERSVNDLVAHFKVSQPAISQHLRVLVEAGLASVRRAGRQRFYRLCPEPLRAVYDWTVYYERFWATHLDRLGEFLDRQAEHERAAGSTQPPPAVRVRLKLDRIENLDLEARR